MLGLYVHVPFCSAICNYCNFNRGLFDAGQKARYVQAVLAEIQQAGRAGGAGRADADTIYFGGGTPSLLEPVEVAGIVAACREAFVVAPDAEITLEANPESVDEVRLAAFRKAGVNRLSFGVQSFREEELLRLSRLHTVARAILAVGEARRAGFDNLSLDLMMWLPEQRVEQWLQSIDGAIALRPDHMSLYLLEVYPNAPLREDMARARWSQAPDDDAASMYMAAMERLESAGYEQYEISNVAKPGCRSRHNLKYWTDGEWLGFGCGAHTTRDGARSKNVSGIDEYIACIEGGRPAALEVRRMSGDERLGDALFTGLRLADGVSLDAIRDRYGVDVWQRYGTDLADHVDAGLVRREGDRLRLTRQGMLLAHEVMTVFV